VRRLLPFVIVLAAAAHAAVVHVPLQSSLALQPGAAFTVTTDATKPAEIGWTNISPTPCTTNCVEANQLTDGMHTSFATGLGGSKKYTPVAGKIAIEYKNLSTQPVTINVYRIERTCDAEACKFFDMNEKGKLLLFRIDQFKSIVTSTDESYSVISGVAVGGKPFTMKAVWWSDDKNGFRFHCAGFIQRWLNNHAPADEYRPYILSGMNVGTADDIVLTRIEACVPKAPHYGVLSEDSVFK
jgi:hypothetical protein